MTNPEPKLNIVRKNKPPEWIVDKKGRQRLMGRWNMQRVAEYLGANPSWQTVDDIARVVYGSTGKVNRDNTRKHIPAQRRFMLHSEQPIVTQYGERGRIVRIKIYNPTDAQDRDLLSTDLEHAKDRNEINEKRYEALRKIFLLQPSTESK